MKIQEAKIIFDKNNMATIVKKSSINYEAMDNLLSPENIVRVMNDIFMLNKQVEEYVYLICMNYQFEPICFFEVSHGTQYGAIVGIREIMIRVLLSGASNIVLVHNHPEGPAVPSYADIEITKRLEKASKILEISFVDHIIVGKELYCSCISE